MMVKKKGQFTKQYLIPPMTTCFVCESIEINEVISQFIMFLITLVTGNFPWLVSGIENVWVSPYSLTQDAFNPLWNLRLRLENMVEVSYSSSFAFFSHLPPLPWDLQSCSWESYLTKPLGSYSLNAKSDHMIW